MLCNVFVIVLYKLFNEYEFNNYSLLISSKLNVGSYKAYKQKLIEILKKI